MPFGSLNTFKLFALSVPDEGNVSCALLSYEIEHTKIHFHRAVCKLRLCLNDVY